MPEGTDYSKETNGIVREADDNVQAAVPVKF